MNVLQIIISSSLFRDLQGKRDHEDKTDTATIADNDADIIYWNVTQGGQTLTLPTLANNGDRILHLLNVGSADGTVDGEDAEAIQGHATYGLKSSKSVTLIGRAGDEWKIAAKR